MKTLLKPALTLLIALSLAACGSNNRADESSGTQSDTVVMDTQMTTGTGSDTLSDSLKEGVDGTGKSNSDSRTRKQQ